MAHTVDPTFVRELADYGAFDVNACFNCGNCTAVCSLTDERSTFPRRFIRYAQLGMKDRLAASKELWLCYYCGDCSDTCPRQAEPGEFVAAARRYVISQYDPTTLARRLYSSRIFTALFLVVTAAVLTLIMLSGFGSMTTAAPLSLGGFIDVEYVHYTGQAVMIVAGLIALLSLGTMVSRLNKAISASGDTGESAGEKSSSWSDIVFAARATAGEIVAQARFGECEADPTPWYVGRRFVHLSIMWGFLGLLAATGLDLLFKEPYSTVPIYYPMRLLGTIAGLFVIYGTSVALINRFRLPDKYFSHSQFSDWLFLGLLWGVTLTGFIVEIAVYQPTGAVWAYIVFLVHIVGAMMLVLLLPFTKFAHAVLRPVALFIHELRAGRKEA